MLASDLKNRKTLSIHKMHDNIRIFEIMQTIENAMLYKWKSLKFQTITWYYILHRKNKNKFNTQILQNSKRS